MFTMSSATTSSSPTCSRIGAYDSPIVVRMPTIGSTTSPYSGRTWIYISVSLRFDDGLRVEPCGRVTLRERDVLHVGVVPADDRDDDVDEHGQHAEVGIAEDRHHDHREEADLGRQHERPVLLLGRTEAGVEAVLERECAEHEDDDEERAAEQRRDVGGVRGNERR